MTVAELLVELAKINRAGRGGWEVDLSLLNKESLLPDSEGPLRDFGYLVCLDEQRATKKVILMGKKHGD